jgi:double-stranded uracil-DNA glycosylase
LILAFTRVSELPLPSVLDGIHNDLGPDTNDDDAKNHLTHDQNTRPFGRSDNVTKADRCEYRDGEVQRVGTRQLLAEVAGRNPTRDEIRAGEQQEKYWNARRKRPDGPERWIRRLNDGTDLIHDKADKRQEANSQNGYGGPDRGAVQRQQVIDRNETNRGSQCTQKSQQDPASPESALVCRVRPTARAISHRVRLTGGFPTTVTFVRFTQVELQSFRNTSLPDLVGPGLKLLFVGINPGLWTAATQTHFAHPGNRFYPALRLAGIVDRDLDRGEPMSEQDRAYLIERGIGITNLVNRATARADELSPAELMAGRTRLEAFVALHHPVVVAIAGVTAYRAAFADPKATAGEQADLLAGTLVWVVPNPSGLNAHATISSLAQAYAEPARVAGVIN